MSDWLQLRSIELAYPWALLLLLLLPAFLWWQAAQRRKRGLGLKLSSLTPVHNLQASWKVKARILFPILQSVAFISLVLALSRPQQTNTSESINSEGIDMVISMDISGSMLAEDFKPNRIEAAKSTAVRFVRERPTDRIGLVIFAGESFTQCPITIDHQVLNELIMSTQSGMLEDGTAIGMGLATAVDRLRNSQAESKVIILMTDGVNNRGKIDPQTALEIAKAFQVRVYTIGIGTEGKALYPVPTPHGVQKQLMEVQIDEALMKQIARETGGKYFRATDNDALEQIYGEIDQLEKTKIEMQTYRQYKELFFPFAFTALTAMFLIFLLRFVLLKTMTA